MKGSQKLKSFEVNGRTITKGYCSCLKARIKDKKFDLYLVNIGYDSNDGKNDFLVSLTENQIIDSINDAVEIIIKPVADENDADMILSIETDTHYIHVFVPRGDD